jgi:hypothetical protein
VYGPGTPTADTGTAGRPVPFPTRLISVPVTGTTGTGAGVLGHTGQQVGNGTDRRVKRYNGLLNRYNDLLNHYNDFVITVQTGTRVRARGRVSGRVNGYNRFFPKKF